MIGLDLTVDAPATVRFHQDAVEQIIQSVEEGVYCALLGPRLSGKTLLLHYVEENLARLLGWTCVYIDLLDMRATTQQAFFSDLIHITAQQLSNKTGVDLSIFEEENATSAVFRGFLADCLETTDRDLVFIIDPLEALPTDLVQALLTSLRAAYMDQQDQERQVTVVVSGALSLATLTVGESSPFRGIARRVFVGDLSAEASQTLILEFLNKHSVSATHPAVQKLLRACSGDIFLIRKLSQCCVDLVAHRSTPIVRSRDVTVITDRFLRQEVFNYAPLVEAVRLIEENPELLQCILLLLEKGQMHRSSLPLPLSPDLDPLYLTGVIEVDQQEQYQLQNEIYQRFLNQHFTPARIGYVLSMAGRWDSAIDYLEASTLQGLRQSRSELLSAVINSMYASEDLLQAVHFLQRGLRAAFGVQKSQVWFHPPYEKYLTLISPRDMNLPSDLPNSKHLPLDADRLETRAYRQRVSLRSQEGGQHSLRAIPLSILGQKTIGVVIIQDEPEIEPVGSIFNDPRERDLELVGFLNQSARALETVGTRRQELALAGRVQASLLPDSPPKLPGWQITAVWQPARETAGDFYDFIPLPNNKLGIVIADVVDKGMGPALLMTLSRTLIRTYAQDLAEQPDELLKITNQRIIQDINGGMFVTLFYGVLDPANGEMVFSNAGQTPPYLLDKQQSFTLDRTGMALGVSEDVGWEKRTLHIAPGAALVLYTDGVMDSQNRTGQLFGSEGIRRTLEQSRERPAQHIQDHLLHEIYKFSGASAPVDDITLMVIVRDL